ncbi:hypothetical protein [Methylocella tundrae]|uniref:Uncharacterized protein n=1 Tax=Methylocella tundrae TaxID=227605 RepID=A0A4U8Z4R4_METTU|nr:hypothetical protein [Methylocella tundrae]WPP04064.1 hypothetical protein SIN04_16640 [Methylocella tundrae]VFU10301.1 conserved protein of unknown function [Methylocella tundrae]
MNTLRLALLSLAALVAIILGWTFLHNAPREPDSSARTDGRRASPQEVAAMRRAIERTVAGEPDYAGFFDELKAAFPAEYEAFIARAAEASAEAGEGANADALMIDAARGLRRSHGILAASADGPALDHYFDAKLAFLRALAGADKALCVDFLSGGNGDFVAFSRDHRPLFAAMAAAGLDAINDGRAKRIKRAAPTDEDFHTLENALRAQGLSNAAIEALLDGKATIPPLEDGEMCQAGEVYLQTLAALPDAARRRIYGFAVQLAVRS